MIRDPAEIKNSNVWEQSKLKSKQSEASVSSNIEKTYIVVGPSNSGKTSFVKALSADIDFETKPTNLIDYTYLRKTVLKKDIIHCYEIGHEGLVEIIPTLIKNRECKDICFILCLDLSKGSQIVGKGVEWVERIRAIGEEYAKKLANDEVMHCVIEGYRELNKNLMKQYEENEDKSEIKPMPFETLIIGTKYDLLEKSDLENRKWVSRALRYISHINNISLYFSSTKNMQIGAQLRTFFQERSQNDKKLKSASQFDHLKPIFINNGDDTIRSLSLPSSGSLDNIEILKKQLESFGKGNEDEGRKKVIDFSGFGESSIDAVIGERKKEIEKAEKALLQQQKSKIPKN